MSYDQQKDQIAMLGGIGTPIITTTGPIAVTRYYVPFYPVYVTEFTAMIVTSPTVTPAILALKRRPTPGSATGEVIIGTLTLPVAAVIGNVYYKRGLRTKCFPGDEIVIDMTQVATAGAATFGMVIIPAWELPGNNTKMIASA